MVDVREPHGLCEHRFAIPFALHRSQWPQWGHNGEWLSITGASVNPGKRAKPSAECPCGTVRNVRHCVSQELVDTTLGDGAGQDEEGSRKVKQKQNK